MNKYVNYFRIIIGAIILLNVVEPLLIIVGVVGQLGVQALLNGELLYQILIIIASVIFAIMAIFIKCRYITITGIILAGLASNFVFLSMLVANYIVLYLLDNNSASETYIEDTFNTNIMQNRRFKIRRAKFNG